MSHLNPPALSVFGGGPRWLWPLQPGTTNNALGSILKTGSGLFLALVVPPFLVRRLGQTTFSAWSLAAELAGYVTLLELGTTNAVAALVARSRDRKDAWLCTASALRVSLWLGAAGIACVLGLVLATPALLHRAPHALVDSTRQAFAILGCASVTVVVTAALIGLHLGRRQLLAPGLLFFVTRALGAVLVIVVAGAGGGLTDLAWTWALASAAAPAALAIHFSLVLRKYGGSQGGRRGREIRHDIRVYSTSFAVWVGAGFLVVGLDTTIVAQSDFSRVGLYSIAASIPLLVQASCSALLAPLVPVVSAGTADVDRRNLVGAQVVRLGWTMAIGLAIAISPVLAFCRFVMRTLTGTTDPASAGVLLVLCVACVVRLSLLPFATAVLATGEHRRALAVPLAEGLGNLGASLLLVHFYGVIGVAIGTLIGAVAGVMANSAVLLPRLQELRFQPGTRLWPAPLAAVLLTLPTLTVGLMSLRPDRSSGDSWLGLVFALLVTGAAGGYALFRVWRTQ